MTRIRKQALDSLLQAELTIDVYDVNNESEQLDLTVQKGDWCKRQDSGILYLNKTGSNTSMSDWEPMGSDTAGTGMSSTSAEIDSKIAAEASTRTANDNAISSSTATAISGEASTRAADDLTLQDNIILLSSTTAEELLAKIPMTYLDTDHNLAANSDSKIATQQATKAYADALVVNLLDYRGAYDASGNAFPSTGGSGGSGAILKGDMWIISVAGTVTGYGLLHVGDSLIAAVDSPGQTYTNWNSLNANLSYVPEDTANKDTDGTLASNSTTKYPAQSAVKTYVDAEASSRTSAVNAEASSRSSADIALQNQIDSLDVGLSSTSAEIDVKIADEASTRTANDTAISSSTASHIAATGTSVHGLGSMATQNANTVAITGGSIQYITDLAVADGGTGASTPAGARANLGLLLDSMLLPSAQTSPNNTVAVAAGTYIKSDGSAKIVFAGGNSPTFPVVTADSRIDLLCISDTGTLTIVSGTQSATPSAPTYPTDKLPIAEVTITETVTVEIITADIRDVRPFLNLGGGGGVSDITYGASWDGVTGTAPSKNTVYDKIETLISDTAYAGSWDGVTTVAPSKNAVYDKIESIGKVSVAQASHGFAVGDVLYLNGSVYTKAIATSVATAEVIGIVATVTDGSNFIMALSGNRVTGLSGLTSGTVYFLSDSSAGLLTATEPTTLGNISKPVLIADSTTSGIFTNQRGAEVIN